MIDPWQAPGGPAGVRHGARLLWIATLLLLAHTERAFPALTLEPVAAGLNAPLYITSARDGSGRLFLVEQPGRIQVLSPGASGPAVFLDITSRVLSGGEQGLLGLAFHPQYAANRRFFVNYTRQPDGATVIAEYRASVADPNRADPQEIVIVVIPQPFSNHNGGMIEFGPEGFLYIGMGDGGSANDPGNRAQNINELLGKILRIDIDQTSGTTPYVSPSDNPFFGAAPGRDEIFAVGLRNPFRFSFDRGGARQLFVGDVGQDQREEVDIVTRGGNYGWRVFEATLCTGLDPTLCAAANFTPPILEYAHTGGRCSIIGGYVYRGTRGTFPAGAYIFGDFCTGEIFQLNPADASGTVSVLQDTTLLITSFGEDEAGELYVVGQAGTVHRLVDAPAAAGGGTGGGGGGGCFITTAAFGSPLAPEVHRLREIRDQYLLPSAVGREIVSWYYHASPPLAAIIAQSAPLRSLTRLVLFPIVAWAGLLLWSPAVGVGLPVLALAVGIGLIGRRARRPGGD